MIGNLSHQLTFHLSNEAVAELDEMVLAGDTTRSALLREIIEEWLVQPENFKAKQKQVQSNNGRGLELQRI